MAVVRDRKLAAPAEPKRLPAEPLPKAAPMSAPLPCCSSTSTTMLTAQMAWTRRINVCIALLSLAAIARCAPDAREIVGHECCAADEATVDVRHREELPRVAWLHASAVKDRKLLRDAAVLLRDAPADERVRFLRLRARRGLAG